MSKSFLVAVTNDLNQDQRMHRICDTLVQDGHRVLLLGREKQNSKKLLNQSFTQKRLKCWFSKGMLFYLEYNIRLFFFAINFKPDIFYAVDLDTLLGCGIAAKFARKKIVHDAHEYFVEVPELEGQLFKKRVWSFIGSTFIPSCDLCISVNHELAVILSEKYNNQFHVIRSVPKTSNGHVKIKNQKSPKIILYQGVLNKGRGLKESIKAVSESNLNVTLRIAGEGDLSKELRSLVIKLGTQKKVEFLGWLSPDALRNETFQADIGLNLLSGKSLNYKYSLANKFFDYLHAGIPSINMNFPVYKRICTQYEVGLCIDNLEQKTIHNAIQTLLNDEKRLLQIEKGCKLAQQEYNWEKESKVLIELINKFT